MPAVSLRYAGFLAPLEHSGFYEPLVARTGADALQLLIERLDSPENFDAEEQVPSASNAIEAPHRSVSAAAAGAAGYVPR